MDRTGLTIPNSKKTHLHLTPKQRTFAEIFVANYPDITKKKAAENVGRAWPHSNAESAAHGVDVR